MLSITEVSRKVESLKRKYAERDGRMDLVASMRRGDMNPFGDLFPADWPKPIVANFIDTAARDVAEVLAPLPTITAALDTMVDDSARKRADKRNKIVDSYVYLSRLETQMYAGCDRYVTYGFLPFRIEADYETHRPKIIAEDPMGGYPEFDQWGTTVSYTKRWYKTELELCALFPDQYMNILTRTSFGEFKAPSETKVEIIKYHDKDQTVMYLPTRQNTVLAVTANPLGKCMVRVAKRPTLGDDLQGQFDDVLWVQLARSKFALLALEAASKSVQAPLAVPTDVQEVAFGADSVIRSATPEKIGRVNVQIPQAAFAVQQELQTEQRIGARYPESRTGQTDASVITGRGVQALNSGFDTQIKAAQQVFAETLVEVFGIALELDEKLWPSERKTIRGVRNGTPYEITYRPEQDIKGDYKVDVTYGLMAGLDPNRALVYVLQGLGAGLFSLNFARRNMPAALNVAEEEQMIDIEKLRGATMQAFEAYGQAIPALAQAGQDPGPIIAKMAAAIHARQRGDSIEDAVGAAFAPPPSQGPPGSEAPAEGGAPGAAGPGGGQLPPGLQPSGLEQGVAPGQAGMAPGGRPALNDLLAGLSGAGAPNLGASVRRRIPV